MTANDKAIGYKVHRRLEEADDLAEFLLIYRGGARPSSESAGQQLASRWGGWLKGIAAKGALVATGDPVVGGRIVGDSANMEPGKDYVHGGDHIGGYSRIRAANLDEAAAMCADCPILGEGGFVEVREIVMIGDSDGPCRIFERPSLPRTETFLSGPSDLPAEIYMGNKPRNAKRRSFQS